MVRLNFLQVGLEFFVGDLGVTFLDPEPIVLFVPKALVERAWPVGFPGISHRVPLFARYVVLTVDEDLPILFLTEELGADVFP